MFHSLLLSMDLPPLSILENQIPPNHRHYKPDLDSPSGGQIRRTRQYELNRQRAIKKLRSSTTRDLIKIEPKAQGQYRLYFSPASYLVVKQTLPLLHSFRSLPRALKIFMALLQNIHFRYIQNHVKNTCSL